MNEGQRRNKHQSLTEKELQSNMPKQYSEENSRCLKCNTDPRKTSSIFALKKKIIETRAWKKMSGMWQMQVMRGAYGNYAPPLVWV